MNYQQASEVRGRGFLGNITDNLVSGQSIGKSFGRGISDTFKAKAIGIKEKFDPIRIAQKMTGNLGGALVGRLFGRKKEDMQHFLGGQYGSSARDDGFGNVSTAFFSTVTAPKKLQSGDSVTDVASKLFAFMEKSREEKNEKYELERNFEEESLVEDEIRHKKLLKAIEDNKKIPQEEKEKPKKEETEKKAPEKTEAKGKEGVKKTTEKTSEPKTKPAEPQVKPPEPKTKPAEPQVKPAVTAKPVEPTPVTPQAPAPTATVPKPSIPSGVSTAVKIGAVATSALAATSSIGGAESGGNYDITFGDKLDKKKNVVRGPNMSPEELFHKKLVDLTLEEVDTLGKERNKKSPSTSAMGKYQFVNSTLFGAKDKKGIFHPGLVQKSGLDMKTTKFTPKTQEKFFQMLHEQDLTTLKRLGVPITPGYEYMAHYIGAGGAKAIYDRKDSDMTVQQALIDAKLPDPVDGKTNQELATIKASEFENVLEKRLNKNGLNSPHAAATSESMPKIMGDKLNQSSIQDKDNKVGQSSTIIMDNTQTNMIGDGTKKTTQSFVQPTAPDLPMYQQLGK